MPASATMKGAWLAPTGRPPIMISGMDGTHFRTRCRLGCREQADEPRHAAAVADGGRALRHAGDLARIERGERLAIIPCGDLVMPTQEPLRPGRRHCLRDRGL